VSGSNPGTCSLKIRKVVLTHQIQANQIL
jgi:hypothetical protein